MKEDVLPITLHIQEKITEASRRKRKIRVTAESLTLGSSRSVDIELRSFAGNFLVEIKFLKGQWWIVNLLKSDHIRVNGRLVNLEYPLHDEDQILIDEHIISFEIEKIENEKKEEGYQFSEQPNNDENLWNNLLKEKDFDEILINGSSNIYVDWKGTLLKSPWSFSSDDFLFQKIQEHTKKSSGWGSWRLDQGLRFQSALPPLVTQPHICIRKARQHVFSLEELEEQTFGTEKEIQFLKQALKEKQSLIISGATSTGKTVLLRSLVEKIDENERLIIIEEESETDWPHPHAVSIEAGPEQLSVAVKECLRLRPDRLIVSEIRGFEAFDFLQAINSGHPGSMTTLHARSPREALARLENLILGSGNALDPLFIRGQLAQNINLIIQLKREPKGKRHIESIQRITGIQKDTILLSNPIEFENSGISQKDLRLV